MSFVEEELMKNLSISEQCSVEEAEVLKTLYESKLKKYHTPSLPKPNESKILFGDSPFVLSNRLSVKISQPIRSPHTPFTIATPTSISTPNDVRKNKNGTSQSMQIDRCDNGALLKLKNSLDLQVAEAERLYYNCDYQQCSQLTETILKIDPYHDVCLPIHISCQVELKQSNSMYFNCFNF